MEEALHAVDCVAPPTTTRKVVETALVTLPVSMPTAPSMCTFYMNGFNQPSDPPALLSSCPEEAAGTITST